MRRTGRRTPVRRKRHLWLGATVVVALAGAGCEGNDDRQEPDPVRAERANSAPAWDTMFVVGGTAGDTLLLQPGRIAADGNGVVLADIHGGRLLRFDTAGTLMWRYGRKGRGPGELSHPRDLKLDATGRSWVLDVENARIAVLSRAGELLREIPLHAVGGRPDDFVPEETGGALLLTSDPERPLVRVDSAGRVRERLAFPWDGFRKLDPLASQLLVAADPTSRRWVAALQMGDSFFPFDGTRSLGKRPFVEHVPWPTVENRTTGGRFGRSQRTVSLASPTFAAWSAAVSESHLYVLFDGATQDGRRLLDVYRLSDGAYRRTFLLPRRVNQIAVGGGLVYATYADPFPALAAWRLPEGGAP